MIRKNAEKDVSRLDIIATWIGQGVGGQLVGILDVASINRAVAIAFTGNALLRSEVSPLKT